MANELLIIAEGRGKTFVSHKTANFMQDNIVYTIDNSISRCSKCDLFQESHCRARFTCQFFSGIVKIKER